MLAGKNSKTTYKAAFVDLIKDLDWDWFITIAVGACPHDDELIRRLRLIEAMRCKQHLVNRYHKLTHEHRYSMAVAFEGERQLGNRHAHVLVHLPKPLSSMRFNLFPSEFSWLWHVLTPFSYREPFPWPMAGENPPLKFIRANTATNIYTVKSVGATEESWSRFEFVTPPKAKQFQNENLSVIRNRNKQRRIALGL